MFEQIPVEAVVAFLLADQIRKLLFNGCHSSISSFNNASAAAKHENYHMSHVNSGIF